MKKVIITLLFIFVAMNSLFADSVYYNYKKEPVNQKSQLDFSNLDMKTLSEAELTFVGMEFKAQGWADFVSLDKPVVLYASCSTDLRARYKNRPSYEYDTTLNKKDVHLKAKNYFYWNTYLQLLLLPDKKHGTNLRCKFNGIENTLSSYIVEREGIKVARTFKFIKRIKDKAESLDFNRVTDLKEVPAPLKYCADNLVCCTYNIHFAAGKQLFRKKKENPNEIKDLDITFYATVQALNFSDGKKVSYKTAAKPKNEVKAKTETKAVSQPIAASKNTSKKKAVSKSKTTTKTNQKSDTKKTEVAKTTEKQSVVAKELAPRTDAELDDDLVAEVLFVTGPENSLKDESSIAPRTDAELDDDLVGD